MEICANPDKIKPSVWRDYYEGIGTEEKYQGSLPFRVKQIFEEMVRYVSNRELTKYICAAGILAHYVGDACQPLHGSRLHDANGVHSPYETKMLNSNRGGNNGVVKKTRLDAPDMGDTNIPNGDAAARRTVDLMRTVSEILPPQKIVDVWMKFAPQARPITVQCGPR